MSILIISGSFGDGKCGVGDFAYHIAISLARLQKEPHLNEVESGDKHAGEILVLTRSDAKSIQSRHGGSVEIGESGDTVWKPEITGLKVITGLDFGLMHSGILRKLVKRIAPTSILVQYPSKGFGWTLSIPLLPYILKGISFSENHRKKPIPLIMTLHEYKDAHPLRKLALRVLLKYCTRIITPCPLEAEIIKSIARRDVVVIPDGNVFAEEIDSEKYETFRRKLADIDTVEKRIEILIDSRTEYGAEDWSPSSVEVKALSSVIDKSVRDRKSIFSYGFIAPSKAPMRMLEVFGRIRANYPDCKLVIASRLNSKDKLHEEFLEMAQRIGNVSIIGPLPAHILKYVCEMCGLQLYTFKDGYTTKRSSLISALSFNTPILTEFPGKHFTEELDGDIVSDLDALSNKVCRILNLNDSEYEEYFCGRSKIQSDYAQKLDFNVIIHEYLKYL